MMMRYADDVFCCSVSFVLRVIHQVVFAQCANDIMTTTYSAAAGGALLLAFTFYVQYPGLLHSADTRLYHIYIGDVFGWAVSPSRQME